MIEVLKADHHDAVRQFIAYPYRLYAGHPHWIPPLRLRERAVFDRRRNPFFEHATAQLFLARHGDRIVGRIAAIHDDRFQQGRPERTAVFGFFEAEDAAAADALLSAAEAWAEDRKDTSILGPLNPSTNATAGALVDGFDSDPMILMPYNPPSYPAFFEQHGYRKAKDLYAWLFSLGPAGSSEKLAKLAEWARDRQGISVRAARRQTLDHDLAEVHSIYCRAWERNWGFVAPTDREAQEMAREMKDLLEPEAVVFVEVEGQTAGCALVAPDINQVLKGTGGKLLPKGLFRLLTRRRIIDQGRLAILGVLPQYRGRSLYPILLHELEKRVSKLGYRRVEFSWVLEDNDDINKPAAAMGAVRYKTYRLYEKRLGRESSE